VKLLVEAGAELSPVSDQNSTPLDKAREMGEEHIAEYLVKAGAKTAVEVFNRMRAKSVTYSDDNDQRWTY